VGKINVHDKIVIKNQKKNKIWKSRKFLHISPSERWFRNSQLAKASSCQRER